MSTNPISFRKKVTNTLKVTGSKYLEGIVGTEYIIVSIYRINYDNTDVDRKALMKDIIFHLSNPDNLKSEVKLIARFSTIFNNRILGVEVQNASIYGQKIEMALDDFDRSLANTIRKHDIIVIHRLNKNSLRVVDAVASMIGLGTSSPSGIKEPSSYLPQAVKNKIPSPTGKLADTLANQFLINEKPIFSGLITLPQSVAGNNIKLTIEAQDMIRIMQHINTEDTATIEIPDLPVNIDNFMESINYEDGLNITGKDELNILHSTILRTLGNAVYEEITSFININVPSASNIAFTSVQLSETTNRLTNFNDRIIIRGISNSMFMVHISPIKALKLFVKYYAKNTGINTFFGFDLWDTNDKNFSDKKTVETIYKKIFKDMIGINPYFTFGMILDYEDDENIVEFDKDELTGRNNIFQLFKKHPLKHVFSQKTFDNIFKNKINEVILLQYLNNKKLKSEKASELLSQFFLNLTNPTSVDLKAKTGIIKIVINNRSENKPLFLNNQRPADQLQIEKPSFIISKFARQLFNENLDKMRVDFSDSLSLEYVISTNFSSVRSTEYNPVLTNQMKSVPITQIVQLFIGALTSIPISQSKETTGFDNTAYNISQRIWLNSAIGFKNLRTGEQSWIYKKGMKPIVFFGLNYTPSVIDNNERTNITYVSDKDTINSKMFTLPSVGSLAIYTWDIKDIHIGYSRFNEGDYDSVENVPQLSLGGSMMFDLFTITGKIDDYISENTEKQFGGQSNPVLKAFPRIGLFRIVDWVSGTAQQGASDALIPYDDFKQITGDDLGSNNWWTYLGYDMSAMNNFDGEIELEGNKKVELYVPLVSGSARLESLGSNMFNALGTGIKNFWKDTAPNFPDDGSAKIGTGDDRVIITGIKDYYDPTKFLPILRSFQHYIKFGFTGINGEGDQNLYKSIKLFQIYHNIKVAGYYLETYKLKDLEDETVDRDLIINSVSELVNLLIGYLGQYHGNDEKKRLMMIKFARRISHITPATLNGDGAPFRRGSLFHPPSLVSAIMPGTIEKHKKGLQTMEILLSFVRSISHYMNRIAKESTTGGVLYCPLKNKADGTIFEIGDAISFVKSSDGGVGDTIDTLVNLVKGLSLSVNKPQTNLDIYKKTYYVWKITYYFGGAGTDPSGSSGSTMRVYLTDSGIHWQSSYEEKDITTKIAESMQLNRLAVKV